MIADSVTGAAWPMAANVAWAPVERDELEAANRCALQGFRTDHGQAVGFRLPGRGQSPRSQGSRMAIRGRVPEEFTALTGHLQRVLAISTESGQSWWSSWVRMWVCSIGVFVGRLGHLALVAGFAITAAWAVSPSAVGGRSRRRSP